MAIKYNVSEDGLRIDTYLEGILDVDTTIDYFDRLINDKRIKHGATEIVYFNRVTDFRVSFNECDRIAENYQEAKARQLIEATVFVCETKLSYGIARMLQMFHEFANPDHRVEIIGSLSELDGQQI